VTGNAQHRVGEEESQIHCWSAVIRNLNTNTFPKISKKSVVHKSEINECNVIEIQLFFSINCNLG